MLLLIRDGWDNLVATNLSALPLKLNNDEIWLI